MSRRAVDQGRTMHDMVEDGPPPRGAVVEALTAGGRKVELVWTEAAEKSGFYYAWIEYPKVKAATKARMLQQYPIQEIA